MAYYRSSSRNEPAGCLYILGFFAVIGLIVLISNLSEHSQKSMIKKARNETYDFNKESYYRQYLDYHPDGKFVSEATEYIGDYYSKHQLSDIANSYSSKTYLTQFEDLCEKYKGTKAGRSLDSLFTVRIDTEYNKAYKSGTIEGWEQYKKVMPQKYWRDADKQIQEIYNNSWGTESKAWRTAQKLNTLDAYEMYLDLYPHGAHAKAADKKVIDLSVADIFAGDHGSLPGMDKTSWSSSGRNTIHVKNDTQYTLTLLYSGKESKRLVLSPHASGTVSLPDGNYRVAASVTAYNVRSYAGTESLTGGEYEVSYYISTTRY